jgi:hypothetical protein
MDAANRSVVTKILDYAHNRGPNAGPDGLDDIGTPA